MITAKEAREISGPSIDEQVKNALNDLSSMIRTSAEKKQSSITIRKEPYANWAYNRSNPGEVGEKVFDELKSAGFKIDTFYRELQFADYGLVISW